MTHWRPFIRFKSAVNGEVPPMNIRKYAPVLYGSSNIKDCNQRSFLTASLANRFSLMKDRMVSGEGKPPKGSFDFHICPGHIMLYFLIHVLQLQIRVRLEFRGIQGNLTSQSSKQLPRSQILSQREKLVVSQ